MKHLNVPDETLDTSKPTDAVKRYVSYRGWREYEPGQDNDDNTFVTYTDYEKLREECNRLHDRLEDNRVYDLEGNRKNVTPGSIPDGISCRDETIALLQVQLDRPKKERDQAHDAAVEECANHIERFILDIENTDEIVPEIRKLKRGGNG